MILSFFFWLFFIVIVYTYIGYPLVLWIILQLTGKAAGNKMIQHAIHEPHVCLFVTAYNEKEFVKQKVENSLLLDYPREKVQYLWVTDGSDDGTPDILREYPHNEVVHQPQRNGKMHAMNRGMKFVKAPVVIFSDTNTLLNRNAIREIVECFNDAQVGCVAGEKRIVQNDADVASAAGEGLYWKYESWVKRMDARLNSAVGAVGELFSIRTNLFKEVEPDTILDDFIISLRIAMIGYKIAYTPNAYAEETASLNVREEMKRKIRIAAGGIQSLIRLKPLLNPFRYGMLSWQFFSHKVLRWTLAPVSLFLIFVLNGIMVLDHGPATFINFYALFFMLQLVCYLLALLGWLLEDRKLHLKVIFAPYYFVLINYAAIVGIFRFLSGKQSVKWEKSKRAGMAGKVL